MEKLKKRTVKTKYPDPRLENQDPKSISKACSSIAHKLRTKTVTKTKTISSTTITVTVCSDTTYPFVLATETAPSTIFYGPGFHTETIATTTETIVYFCNGYGIGCATQVPTPCCDENLTCTNIGAGYPQCVPTNSDAWSTLWDFLTPVPEV
ncbi:hypothetical protein ABW19_dt0205240 [Dactylella cylindrospora]|nr:hypothetical protein ABW19_dt0205240 [Dactylella cylindrospora]